MEKTQIQPITLVLWIYRILFVPEFEFDSAGTLRRRLAALHRLEGRLDALLELLQ